MNLPTKITVTRLFMIPLIVISYCCHSLWNYMFLITCALFFIASTTDYVDGYIARKYNMVTSLGKFLDPIADKVLVLTGLIIILEARYISLPYIAMICIIIILAREFIVGLFRQMAALKNHVLAADKLGKYKTFSTMLAIGSLLLVPFKSINVIAGLFFEYAGLALLLIATILTVISGINYLAQDKVLLKDDDSKQENNVVDNIEDNTDNKGE